MALYSVTCIRRPRDTQKRLSLSYIIGKHKSRRHLGRYLILLLPPRGLGISCHVDTGTQGELAKAA